MSPRKKWRSVLRWAIDLFAMFSAWAIQFAASGSQSAAFITGLAVAAYGMWCYWDGAN